MTEIFAGNDIVGLPVQCLLVAMTTVAGATKLSRATVRPSSGNDDVTQHDVVAVQVAGMEYAFTAGAHHRSKPR